MFVAQIGDGRAIGLFHHAGGGGTGDDLAQGRTVQALRCREIGARVDQNGAALFDVVAHVIQIDRRQNATAFVTVEDDQVEVFDFVQKQFARWECDQGQFVDRHAILFFGWAQNGEVHQIDRTVRFQQVPPCAPARMGFAGHQQNAQAVAHAVDLHQRRVVAVGQFAVGFWDRKLDHVHTAMGQGDGQFHVTPDGHGKGLCRCAVDGNIDGGFAFVRRGTVILNA